MAKLSNNAEFKKMQEQVVENAIAGSGGGSNFYKDMIKFEQPGKTYRLRLINTIEPEYNRSVPFIHLYKHSIETPSGKFSCTCPKTFGIQKYWEVCPICELANDYYRQFKKTGDKTMKDLGNRVRSMIRGYAMVYVISDPVTPTNNGTIKKFFFDSRGKKFFDLEIYGITGEIDELTKKPIISNDRLGFDAFDLENGFDLIIVTEPADKYVNCKYSFARKPSPIIDNMKPSDMEKVQKMIEEMEFDTILNVKYDKEEAPKFFNKYYATPASTPATKQTAPATRQDETKSLSQTVVDDLLNDVDPSKESGTTVVEDDIPYDDPPPPSKPDNPPPPPPTPKTEPKKPVMGLIDSEVDDLLRELDM